MTTAIPPDAVADAEWLVFDDLRPSAKIAAIAGLFFLAGAIGLPALLLAGIYYWAGLMLAAILLVVGGGLLLQLWPRFRRRRTPFLRVSARGFHCPGLREPFVPWSAIDHVEVSGSDPIVCTDFYFAPAADLPTRDGSRANVQLSRGRRLLSIRGPAPRGMTLHTYAARINAAMGGDPAPSPDPAPAGRP
jgi:hypothetical protein